MSGEPLLEAEKAKLEEHAEKVRASFRAMPGFLEMLRDSRADIDAGRVISHNELVKKYEIAD